MTTVWLGTAGWSYFPDWVGPFYPPGTQPGDALAAYSQAFNFVEIDATFYAAPAPATVERWAPVLPATSRVSVKAPRELVQDTGLEPPDAAFGHFVGPLLAPLLDRLAAVVVQLPPSFDRTPRNDVALRAFCATWAGVVPLAVELRDPSWLAPEVADLLRAHDVTWVCNDMPGMPRVGVRTGADAYVRLLGPHRGLIGKASVQRPDEGGRSFWVDQVEAWAAEGARHVYVVANNHYEGHAPATLRSLAAALRERGLDVAVGAGVPAGQLSLF